MRDRITLWAHTDRTRLAARSEAQGGDQEQAEFARGVEHVAPRRPPLAVAPCACGRCLRCGIGDRDDLLTLAAIRGRDVDTGKLRLARIRFAAGHDGTVAVRASGRECME